MESHKVDPAAHGQLILTLSVSARFTFNSMGSLSPFLLLSMGITENSFGK